MPGVRAATLEDAERIVELTAAGWRAGYPGIVPQALIEKLPVAAWRHDVSSGLRAPLADAFTRIAELDGETVGYAYVAAPGREQPAGSRVAELVAIYVDPRHWRAGVGRGLAASALAGAGEAGYERMLLWTFEANARARAFYRELGWREDGAARPHRASGTPTIRMSRSVTMPGR